MSNTDKYISLLNEVVELYSAKKQEEEIVRIKRENDFFALCDELCLLYDESVKSLLDNYISPFLREYSFLNTPSLLSVASKKEKETYHSMYLHYVFSEKTAVGSSVFFDFCNMIGCETEKMPTIKQKLYEVKAEFSTGKQRKRSISQRRFDLLVTDNENQWLVLIENKINSNVGLRNGHQLKAYQDICDLYEISNKTYVLLSYKESNRKEADAFGWIYVDYYSLFYLLLKYAEKDGIIKDYLKTLYSLLFPDVQISYDYDNGSLYRCWLFCKRIILNGK